MMLAAAASGIATPVQVEIERFSRRESHRACGFTGAAGYVRGNGDCVALLLAWSRALVVVSV